MIERKFKTEAETMAAAIKKLAENPEALESIESYLSFHFESWLKKYANDPAGLASEFEMFSNI